MKIILPDDFIIEPGQTWINKKNGKYYTIIDQYIDVTENKNNAMVLYFENGDEHNKFLRTTKDFKEKFYR